MEENLLIHDLGIVVVCAVVVSIIFHRLKLPIIFGYVLSGVLVGPHLFEFSPVKNIESIRELSELGVVFLMFYIGLEFDLQKLRRVMGPSFLAVTLQTVVLIFLGMQMAPLLGMGRIDGVFLGAILAIASSMVVFSVVKDLGDLKQPYAQMAIGVLILEDIIAIILLVVLSGVAVTGHLEWKSVWQITFLVAVFVVMVFFVGKMFAPALMKILHKIGSMELITLFAVGMILGVSILAENFHFSVALGAFLAGSILSQASLVHEIERAIEPLRSLFTAVFFVSIGMLVEPGLLWQEWAGILLLSVLKIVATIVACWSGLFLAGEDPKTGFRAALVKSQVGEFSFIIAALGQTLGATHPSLMAIAVGVALVTILATPFLAKNSERIFTFFEENTPDGVITMGRFYQNVIQQAQTQLDKLAILKLIKRPLLQLTAYVFIITALVILANMGDKFFEGSSIKDEYSHWITLGVWLVAAVVCLPFFVAIIRNLNATIMLITETALTNTSTKQFMKGRVRNIFNAVVLAVVILASALITLSVAAPYLPDGASLVVTFLIVIIVGGLFWRHMVHLNSQIEYHFMQSFNQQARSMEEKTRQKALKDITKKYPWPVTVTEVRIEDGSFPCGKRIVDLHLRDKTGASVIALSRGRQMYFDPSPESPLFPADRLVIFGSNQQNKKAERLLTAPSPEDSEMTRGASLTIEKFYLARESSLTGETLANAALRRRYGINVLGIQRGEDRITSPSADEVIASGDVLYVVGSDRAIRQFEEESGSLREGAKA